MTHGYSSTSSSDQRPEREALDAPARRLKFPVAALAALVFIGAFEAGFVWKYRYRFWDANYVLLEHKREAMTEAPKPDTVAILGMSRFYHVRPGDIEQMLGNGAKVTNYAWGWCGIEAYEAMLRGMLQAGRVPEVILTDGIPELFSYAPHLVSTRKNEDFRAGLAQAAPAGGLLRTGIGWKDWDWVWSMVSRFMTPPSTLYRHRVVDGLWTLLRERELPPLPPGYDATVEPWLNKGWFLMAPGKTATPEEHKQFEAATGPYVLRDNEAAQHAYERFVRLADENGIRVILSAVPSNPVMYEAFEREGVYAAYDTWLDRLERKYEHFVAPQPRWMNWLGSLADSLHVNEAGADRHMKLVLEQLKKYGQFPGR